MSAGYEEEQERLRLEIEVNPDWFEDEDEAWDEWENGWKPEP